MKLEQAYEENHWRLAQRILNSVAINLIKNDKKLWDEDDVTPDKLKLCYTLSELHFARKNNNLVGLVFILERDDYFWPDIKTGDSLFIHKLTVLPDFQGMGYGMDLVL